MVCCSGQRLFKQPSCSLTCWVPTLATSLFLWLGWVLYLLSEMVPPMSGNKSDHPKQQQQDEQSHGKGNQ
ncbi:hypothetical protein SBA5_290195 [Candidatus Sulfotelmatomonas gaucii]|uniref:Uncharacterized protein n=1 Tax=Candidatus Sulfuritelmatomonas gaucii TaxID=2043161 RepID=A0A2N9LAR9_9BACT|nr:hypothetical protein SBA5_290195 [Candidatus Sulfotelmatomonas gaucii]